MQPQKARREDGPMAEEPGKIEAAFVFAWEWSFCGRDRLAPGPLEGAVYPIRCSIPLDRKRAQEILRRGEGREEGRAALVLLYEGIGAHREEADYTFSREDLDDLARVRQRSRMTFGRAVETLRTPARGEVGEEE